MTPKNLLIVYYSVSGNTKLMAELIAEGARQTGVEVTLKRVEECKLDDLIKADGIIVGSPTYFSNVAWQVKKLIDESIVLYEKGRQLKDKVGGCFTAAGTRKDGEDCIRILELTLGQHHRLKILPGIIKASSDPWDDAIKTCRNYGQKIGEEMNQELA